MVPAKSAAASKVLTLRRQKVGSSPAFFAIGKKSFLLWADKKNSCPPESETDKDICTFVFLR